MLPTILGSKFIFNALQFTSYSSELSFRPVEIPTDLHAHEVLIKTNAVSVNFVDTLLFGLSSLLWGSSAKGFGCDFSGIVVQTGSKSKFEVGDEVFGSICDSCKAIGSFSEYIPIDETKTFFMEKIPKGMSFEEAASLGIVSATAFQALSEHKNLKGKNVLIVGGGTSVGSYAIQIAKKYFKARSIVSTCSLSSMERVKSFGCDKLIDYNNENKLNSLLDYVEREGKFDLIVDTVRDQSLFPHTIDLVKGKRDGGNYIVLAGLETNDYKNPSLSDLLPCWEICKFSKKSSWSWSGPTFKMLTAYKAAGFGNVITELWKSHNLDIVIDSQFDAKTEFNEAIEKLVSFKAKGKVVCTF